MRPIRVLWNEIIAFVFIVLAIPAMMQGFHTWRKFDGSSEHLFRIVMTGIFSLVMLAFGVSSYLRARRISRS